MLANLIIPVQDTESAQFEFEGNLTRDTWEDMVIDHFNKTDRQIDAFMHRNRNMGYAYSVQNRNPYDERYYDDSDDDNEVEVEVLLLDSKKRNFDEEFLYGHVDNGDMFIMLVNVNPEELDDGAESELKYWLDDSMRVWDDDDLDKKTKLGVSPPRDLKIVLSDGNKYTLKNSKIFEDYSDERHPLYFAIIVEKITL